MDVIKPSPFTATKSREDYKKIWISLFDVKVLSSCYDDDYDLFRLSALLKTAFNCFSDLKKRLTDAQSLVEILTRELKETKIENNKFLKEINGPNPPCVRCQNLTGRAAMTKGENSRIESVTIAHGIGKSAIKNRVELDLIADKKDNISIPKIVIPECKIKGGNGQPIMEQSENLDFRSSNISSTCSRKTTSDPPMSDELSSVTKEGNNVSVNEFPVSQESFICKTPEKKSCHNFFKKSPVIFRQSRKFKKPSVSADELRESCKSRKRLPKSPNKGFKLDCTGNPVMGSPAVFNRSDVNIGSHFVPNPNKKRKFISLRLPNKSCVALEGEPASGIEGVDVNRSVLPAREVNKNVPQSMPSESCLLSNVQSVESVVGSSDLPNRNGEILLDKEHNGERTPSNVTENEPPSPVILFLSQTGKEEVEIIMPSPESSKAPSSAPKVANAGPTDVLCKPLGNGKKGKSNHSKACGRKSFDMTVDTDATYFVPLEELEAMGSDEATDCVDGHAKGGECVDGEEEQVGAEEEEGVEGGGYKGTGDPDDFISSFDRIPEKSPSPKFKYQQPTVRKKKERMKLDGWECRNCQRYYDAAGIDPDSTERKILLNKCSRHRDKFSPPKCSPKGFWDPLFPETPT